jgi:hypothetical protein
MDCIKKIQLIVVLLIYWFKNNISSLRKYFVGRERKIETARPDINIMPVAEAETVFIHDVSIKFPVQVVHFMLCNSCSPARGSPLYRFGIFVKT